MGGGMGEWEAREVGSAGAWEVAWACLPWAACLKSGLAAVWAGWVDHPAALAATPAVSAAALVVVLAGAAVRR